MNLLLLSMPDSFEHMPTVVIRMPNGALSSLAGNIDPHHHVAIADLILVQRQVRQTVERLVKEHQPDLVGLSVMTFQRRTAQKIIALVRSLKPDVRIVVGGYDPSLACEAYTDSSMGVDFVVRGEGEVTFRRLLCAIESGEGYSHVDGLSYRNGDQFQHNKDRPVSTLDGGEVQLPRRDKRVLDGFTFLGRQVDVIETSRGCTYDCSFCSIIEMRGRNFHTYKFDRVIQDIQDAYDRGARAIFIVDDNITLNVNRFEALCQAIIDAGLNRIHYSVQATTSSIANHAETMTPLMRRAGFRYVFLGIENILEGDLDFLRASSKNSQRENGRRVGNATTKAIEYLHRNKMYVVGGLIVGNPDDTRESIRKNLDFARRYVDWPYIQHPTPYPGTPMTRDFERQGLITNDRLEEYDGTTAVVRTKYVTSEEIEFMRWQVDRWMKTKHIFATAGHNFYVFRNAFRLLAHSFRGSSLKSMLGLEAEQKVFERYRSLRSSERIYI